MIDTLEIKNFKSIRALKLDCKRINVFIGEPNTGKSNILESFGMLSFPIYGRRADALHEFVRFENTGDLFYDGSLDNAIEINSSTISLILAYGDGRFTGKYGSGGELRAEINGSHTRLDVNHASEIPLDRFKFYRFQVKEQFRRPESDYLLPPSGDNLVSLLVSHKELRPIANDLFSPTGHRLGLRPQEHKIEIVKQFEDIIVSVPYRLGSETLQRLVFYLAAIYTNKESVLVFEEPESHSFPYHTKYLAETIALDEDDNQYFIATHNPYFLLPVLEKAPKDDVAVFVIYYEDYQTKVRPLSQQEIEDSLEIDIFSNLDRFLEK